MTRNKFGSDGLRRTIGMEDVEDGHNNCIAGANASGKRQDDRSDESQKYRKSSQFLSSLYTLILQASRDPGQCTQC